MRYMYNSYLGNYILQPPRAHCQTYIYIYTSHILQFCVILFEYVGLREQERTEIGKYKYNFRYT